MNDTYYFKKENGELDVFSGQIVCLFETDDNEKYMVYTNNIKNDNNELIIYGVTVNSENILSPINNDDLYLIEDSINLLRNKYGKYHLEGEANE